MNTDAQFQVADAAAEPAAERGAGWRWLAAVVGFLAPLSFNIGYFLREDKKRTFIAGMDLAVVLLIVPALMQWRTWLGWLKGVPKTLWLFVLLALVGYVAAGMSGTQSLHGVSGLLDFKLEFLKKWAGNYLEYLLIAPLLVALLMDGKTDRLRFLLRGLIVAGLIAAAAGCWDFWNQNVLDVEVNGLYDHRNLLGGVMALLVPLAAAVVIFESCKITQAAALLLVILGTWCQTTAGALLGIIGGVLAVTAVAWVLRAQFHRCTFKILTLTGLMLALPLGSQLLSPRAPNVDDYTAAQVAAHYRGYTLQPRSQLDAALESIAPWKYAEPSDAKSAHTRQSDRVRRLQAQINLVRREPFGCGTGLYQKEIGNFYGGEYIKPAVHGDIPTLWGAEADEPGTFGLYEVIASEMGLIGLLAFLALILSALARAVGRIVNASVAAAAVAAADENTAPVTAMGGHGSAAQRQPISFDGLAGMVALGALSGVALCGVWIDPVASRGPAGVAAVALGLVMAWRGVKKYPAAAAVGEANPAASLPAGGAPLQGKVAPDAPALVLDPESPEAIRARQDEGAIKD